MARSAVSLMASSLFVLAASFLSACSTGGPPAPIGVDASDGRALVTATALEIASVGPRAGSGTVLERSTAEALRQRADAILRKQGHPVIGPAADGGDGTRGGDMQVVIEAEAMRTPRRSWSSDPDASGSRMVARTEAVVCVRVLSRIHGLEIWRSEARTTLRGRPGGAGAEVVPDSLWQELLEAALARAPSRPPAAGPLGSS